MAQWSGQGGSDSQQLIKSYRSMMAISDDNMMTKQIQATHSPDGREVDVRPLFNLIEDILNRATLQVDNAETGVQAQMDIEIAYKALGGMDAHATTLSLFGMLSSHSCDAKLVLTLAAFALNYGEFWLLAQIYSSNQLAKSMAILKQLPSILEHTGSLKPQFDALNNMIKAMMDVSKCIIEFRGLPSNYISQDVPEFATGMAHIPVAVYWTIRSVVACAIQITTFTSMGYTFVSSTSEAWELSTLTHKLKNIHEHLKKLIAKCYQHIEEKKCVEAYQMLIRLFESIHIDNMKILKALIYAKDDLQPLVDGSTKRRVNIDVLRRKNVLLLITDLDISHDELSILDQIYNESRLHMERLESPYKLVWIPIADHFVHWDETMQQQFETQQSKMPWYTVYHPSLIDKAVIRYIKEVWHFKNKPVIVVLDPQGRVVCLNAIHMIWIWGSNAFPFTSLREEALWKEETWRLKLLVGDIDPTILEWIKEGKYIFLYGGDDVEWVRRFTTAARSVANAECIPLEMVYLGKSNNSEQVRRVMATITVKNLGHFWLEMKWVWLFWTSLESMVFSKLQLGSAYDQDRMMQEIKKLLSYDRHGGWAVLSKGSNVLVNGHGTTILPALLEYDMWKEHVPIKGFDESFIERYQNFHSVSRSCCRFEFSSHSRRIPRSMTCPECHRIMKKFTTFCCCHDVDVQDSPF